MMLPFVKESKQLTNFFLQYYFEKQLYTFFAKLKTKKIISIFTFMLQIKNALKHKLPLTFFYKNKLFLYFLKICKMERIVANYFCVPHSFFPASLKCTNENFFLRNNVCILFPQPSLFSNNSVFKTLLFLSTPSRKIFVSFFQLAKMALKLNTTLILATQFGLMTHREALVKKCGGLLLCFIQ